MRFILALVISIALALVTSPMLFTEEPSAEVKAANEQEALKAKPFSLDPYEDDSVEMIKFKAALRLLSSYTVTVAQISACSGPEVEKILSAYHGRNGNSINQVMHLIKQRGGLTPEVRKVMDERTAKLVQSDSRNGNCWLRLKEVAAGNEDLYKSPKYAGDYQLLRTKTK